MHDTIKKPRHKTPSSAKQGRNATSAEAGKREDSARLLHHHRSQFSSHAVQDEPRTRGIESRPILREAARGQRLS
jgi:hypothetical protein